MCSSLGFLHCFSFFFFFFNDTATTEIYTLSLHDALPIYSKESGGRWSLVDSLRAANLTPTERVTARVHQLLERHGIVTREAVQAEGLAGGFAAVYGVLKAMEDAGRVRRGYFVAGRGATQFALPGAVDRLRALREPGEEPRYVFLAATDPANP